MVHKYEETRDQVNSSNITVEDYNEILNLINSNYGSYHAFLILQGTDTLAYTTSLHSFACIGLNKLMILTGSMIPMSSKSSDTFANIFCSLTILGHFYVNYFTAYLTIYDIQILSVYVFFKDKLMRGVRTTKRSASDIAAFDSPNIKPITEFAKTFILRKN